MNIRSLILNTKFVGYDGRIYSIVGKDIVSGLVTVKAVSTGEEHQIKFGKLLDIMGY